MLHYTLHVVAYSDFTNTYSIINNKCQKLIWEAATKLHVRNWKGSLYARILTVKKGCISIN